MGVLGSNLPAMLREVGREDGDGFFGEVVSKSKKLESL